MIRCLHIALVCNNSETVQAQYKQVKLYSERSLQIREKALGPYHPDVAMSLDNLADLLLTQVSC